MRSVVPHLDVYPRFLDQTGFGWSSLFLDKMVIFLLFVFLRTLLSLLYLRSFLHYLPYQLLHLLQQLPQQKQLPNIHTTTTIMNIGASQEFSLMITTWWILSLIHFTILSSMNQLLVGSDPQKEVYQGSCKQRKLNTE